MCVCKACCACWVMLTARVGTVLLNNANRDVLSPNLGEQVCLMNDLQCVGWSVEGLTSHFKLSPVEITKGCVYSEHDFRKESVKLLLHRYLVSNSLQSSKARPAKTP